MPCQDFPLKMSIFQVMAKNTIFPIFGGSYTHFIKANSLFWLSQKMGNVIAYMLV